MANTYLPLGRVHIGDVNTKFMLTVIEQVDPNTQAPVALVNTNLQQMIFLKSDNVTKSTFTASINSPPGADGVIYYKNTDPNFINMTGLWRRAAKLTFTDGSVFTSNSAEFQVIDQGIE